MILYSLRFCHIVHRLSSPYLPIEATFDISGGLLQITNFGQYISKSKDIRENYKIQIYNLLQVINA